MGRLAIWAAVSVLMGTALVAWLGARRAHSPLLKGFAVLSASWGAGLLLVAMAALQMAALRDLAGATSLDRALWFVAGASVGVVGVGATLALMAWRNERRLGATGAGLGLVVQGLALLVLDLQFLAHLVR